MRIRVTAVLVAQQGGELLDETIAGLAAQTVRPDVFVAVNNGDRKLVTDQLISSGAAHVLGLPSRVPFGRAVQQGIEVAPPAAEEVTDWIWLLAEDSCPEPDALEHIVGAVARAQSVVVAGPKLVDWDHPERIVEVGQTLTRYGSRWLLRRQELDQQQYDHLQDVLGVGPVGMLVRRDIWEQLGGFDPALPVYDDGLDFCVRAHLAGYRVEVAPVSRLRVARTGVAGPRINRRRSAMRTAHRQGRTAHLHRRIAYAPVGIAALEWIGLPVYAVLRMLWALIRGQPGYMLGEFAAAFAVFLRPGRILASRRRIRRQNSAGWASLRPLRVDPKTVRTARMIDREAILASTGRQRKELHFVSTGGLAVLCAAIVAAIALTWWAFSQTSLVGGGIAPLSSFSELWRNTHTLDGVPADPFTWVLALLGTLTFWNPSHAVVLFLIAATPLSALGAWIWAAQITDSKAARALVGIGFALSPALIGSLGEGRLPTLILTVVMPWLLLAATRCRESWSWAGTASLLAAVVLACAPVLIPGAIVILVAGIIANPRGAARVLTTALAPAVFFAPKLFAAITSGRPLDLLMDPGIVQNYAPGSLWHMLLGFPEFGLHGWAVILEQIGLGGPPATLLVGVLMAPIALLAVLGLFTGRVVTTLFCALLGGVGMLTAITSAQLQLGFDGAASVPLWTGSGLAVYWLAVLTLGAIGAETLGRAATPIVAISLAAAIVAVSPVAVKLVTNQTPLQPGITQMPALVRAAGESNPNVRTLLITPLAPHEVRVRAVTGTGLRLDQVRTVERTSTISGQDRELAELVGGLASIGGSDISAQLRAEDIGYVLLGTDGDEVEQALLQNAFDQHASLASAGVTEQGLLWRVIEGEEALGEERDAEQSLRGTSLSGNTIWAVQIAVLAALLLLALPTAEVVERPERRPRRRKKSAAPPPAQATLTTPVESTLVADQRVSEGPHASNGSDTEVEATAAEAEQADKLEDPVEPGLSDEPEDPNEPHETEEGR